MFFVRLRLFLNICCNRRLRESRRLISIRCRGRSQTPRRIDELSSKLCAEKTDIVCPRWRRIMNAEISVISLAQLAGTSLPPPAIIDVRRAARFLA